MRTKIPALLVFTVCPAWGQTVHDAIANLNTEVARLQRSGAGSSSASPNAAPAPGFDHVEFGKGTARFKNQSNGTGVIVGVSTQGNGLVRGYTADGKQIFSIGHGVVNKGGVASFFSDAGTRIAEIGARNEGDHFGSARFYDNKGAVSVEVGSLPDGSPGGVWVGGEKKLDYAETFDLARRDNVVPGSVMSMSDDGAGLVLSSSAYDAKVVGVISGAGGYQAAFQAGARADGSADMPIAMAGRVFVRTNCSNGAVRVGDLLVASASPGVAMRSSEPARQTGAVIGKALRPLQGDACQAAEALLEMLVMAR